MMKPSFDENLVGLYRAFRTEVYNPKSVLYPCCATDSSPSQVFDSVTYVDSESQCRGAIEGLVAQGYTAFKQDIREYMPSEEHDLLILLNPAIPSEWATRHVMLGGYIIANDYHGNASEMFSDPTRYELWGTLQKKAEGVSISQHLEGLFEPVNDFEELRVCRADHYDFIRKCFPYLLLSSGITPSENIEEMYLQFRDMMRDSRVLPAKRVAERYIFVKR